ncbi:TPA: hypothetical protein ACX3DU_004674, partial [Vibrio parahaemolyticus]
FNHVKSVACVFSLLPKSSSLGLFGKLAALALLSGHLFVGAKNSDSCLIEFQIKFNVRTFGSISKLDFV